MDQSWHGKVLVFYLANPGYAAQAGVAVVSPKLEVFEGRTFLVGLVPTAEKDWASGLTVAIAWEQVAHYLIFDSTENYESRLENAPTFWDEKRNGPPPFGHSGSDN